jgi:hypothetical protein
LDEYLRTRDGLPYSPYPQASLALLVGVVKVMAKAKKCELEAV